MSGIAISVESNAPGERNVSLRAGNSWCRARELSLRSGLQANVTSLEFEGGFEFETVQPAAEVELVISKGAPLRVCIPAGQPLKRGGSSLQVGRTLHASPLRVSADGDTRMQCVSVSLTRARLCELLGSGALPEALRGDYSDALTSYDMTPKLFRLLEELTAPDASRKSWLLWHEAKCQELIALVTDELAEARPSSPQVSQSDLDRLERVRQRMVQQLSETPSLLDLAKLGGFSETKLKVVFRAAFDMSVFAYLRRARLEEARRLLLMRRLTVTEVAARVGYANPSKFAAAFRRHYQQRPSDL